MLNHGRPAALDGLVQRLLAHVVEGNFLVLVLVVVEHAAGIGIGGADTHLHRLTALLQLLVVVAAPAAGSGVLDPVANLDEIFPAPEGVGLDETHALGTGPVERHVQGFLAVWQHVTGLLNAITGGVIGRGDQGPVGRRPALCKSGLGNEQLGQGVIHQPEGLVRLIEGDRILQQIHNTQIATEGIDHRMIDIGLHLDAIAVLKHADALSRHRAAVVLLSGNGPGFRHFGARHLARGGRRFRLAGDGLGRRGRRILVFLPGIPDHEQDQAKGDDEQESLGFHGEPCLIGRSFRARGRCPLRARDDSGRPGECSARCRATGRSA